MHKESKDKKRASILPPPPDGEKKRVKQERERKKREKWTNHFSTRDCSRRDASSKKDLSQQNETRVSLSPPLLCTQYLFKCPDEPFLANVCIGAWGEASMCVCVCV